jgi:hypothetical protein
MVGEKHTMTRLLMVAILSILLAGCAVFGGDDSSPQSQADSVIIEWDRSPGAVVFRAEVVGGDDENTLYRRNEVPLCTIYGDGHVVWSNSSYEDGSQVLFDRVTDAQIGRFVDQLVTYWEVYNHDAGLDLLISEARPVVEQLTLTVNGQTHITDAFGGWDYNYFLEILNTCATLGETPTVFEPHGGWVSAERVTFNAMAPVNSWNAEATGLDLDALATTGERQWVSGQVLRVLWFWIHNSPPTLQFAQSGGVFRVALEVPSVTRDSPPPPEN